MPRLRSAAAAAALFLAPAFLAVLAPQVAHAQDAADTDGGSQADAERKLQSYLAMWSDDAAVSAATVDRFYAPAVTYYGHRFSRAAVLADKQAFIRSFPVRDYREVPGTFAGRCNGDRSRCRVSAEVRWRRVDRHGAVSQGQARLGFDFVPIDGGRKIARESATPLDAPRARGG